ncbi:tripartite tricarboxylate transporter TctB family protein [Flaviflexus ciconiae]|uniref:Tripartite tricarboxylate transporter TctB family protein n=1 Tax=Flaviflexus ciconiae TaxID=2496867 RepID=A0A3S9PY41_9ACTO|nr:tripartite tricarboxylate transporter TctB family protein [Flaviflexus ciconiae]AZQ77244.1 tripartite tricarboxylate transporter TctB family protein [Flaviflexus ciconiae]
MTTPENNSTLERQRSIPDIVLAAIVIVGGIAIIIYASGMKLLNTGQMGPGLFPTLIGWLLIIFGAVLLFQGVRGKAPAADDADVEVLSAEEYEQSHEVQTGGEGGAYALVAESPGRLLFNGLVVVAGILAYIFLADTLGFIITLFAVLFAIMVVLREKVLMAAIYSAAFTIVLYLVFEKGLLVQLPNGILGF